MLEAVVCGPYCTAVGRFDGQFRSLSAEELGQQLLRGLLRRTGLADERVEEVIFAQCYPTMDAPALGRVLALDAGLPAGVPGMQLDRAGLRMADRDLIELNEAFAAQVLACTHEWRFGPDDFVRMNVNGLGISLGYPVGATGTRILTTLLREMDRREVLYGLETMCIGGGQGLVAVFERVAS